MKSRRIAPDLTFTGEEVIGALGKAYPHLFPGGRYNAALVLDERGLTFRFREAQRDTVDVGMERDPRV